MRSPDNNTDAVDPEVQKHTERILWRKVEPSQTSARRSQFRHGGRRQERQHRKEARVAWKEAASRARGEGATSDRSALHDIAMQRQRTPPGITIRDTRLSPHKEEMSDDDRAGAAASSPPSNTSAPPSAPLTPSTTPPALPDALRAEAREFNAHYVDLHDALPSFAALCTRILAVRPGIALPSVFPAFVLAAIDALVIQQYTGKERHSQNVLDFFGKHGVPVWRVYVDFGVLSRPFLTEFRPLVVKFGYECAYRTIESISRDHRQRRAKDKQWKRGDATKAMEVLLAEEESVRQHQHADNPQRRQEEGLEAEQGESQNDETRNGASNGVDEGGGRRTDEQRKTASDETAKGPSDGQDELRKDDGSKESGMHLGLSAADAEETAATRGDQPDQNSSSLRLGSTNDDRVRDRLSTVVEDGSEEGDDAEEDSTDEEVDTDASMPSPEYGRRDPLTHNLPDYEDNLFFDRGFGSDGQSDDGDMRPSPAGPRGYSSLDNTRSPRSLAVAPSVTQRPQKRAALAIKGDMGENSPAPKRARLDTHDGSSPPHEMIEPPRGLQHPIAASKLDDNARDMIPPSAERAEPQPEPTLAYALYSLSGERWLSATAIETVLDALNPNILNIHVLRSVTFDIDNPATKGSRKLRGLRSEHDLIIVPLCAGRCHWTVAVLKRSERRVVLYDPMHAQKYHERLRAVFHPIPPCLDLESVDRALQPWRIDIAPNTPRQRDGVSCGVLILIFALSHMAGTPIPSTVTPAAWRQVFEAIVRRAKAEQDGDTYTPSPSPLPAVSTVFHEMPAQQRALLGDEVCAAHMSVDRHQAHCHELRQVHRFFDAFTANGGAAMAEVQKHIEQAIQTATMYGLTASLPALAAAKQGLSLPPGLAAAQAWLATNIEFFEAELQKAKAARGRAEDAVREKAYQTLDLLYAFEGRRERSRA